MKVLLKRYQLETFTLNRFMFPSVTYGLRYELQYVWIRFSFASNVVLIDGTCLGMKILKFKRHCLFKHILFGFFTLVMRLKYIKRRKRKVVKEIYGSYFNLLLVLPIFESSCKGRWRWGIVQFDHWSPWARFLWSTVCLIAFADVKKAVHILFPRSIMSVIWFNVLLHYHNFYNYRSNDLLWNSI